MPSLDRIAAISMSLGPVQPYSTITKTRFRSLVMTHNDGTLLTAGLASSSSISSLTETPFVEPLLVEAVVSLFEDT